MTNPLDEVMDWYAVALDCMRVTSRVLEKEIRQAVTSKHIFYRETSTAGLQRVDHAKDEVNDLVVLSLTSVFERRVRDHLLDLSCVSNKSASQVEEAIRLELIKDLEYWRLSDRVSAVFSYLVPANLSGQVKQIIEYRNWVAHGRSAANPPSTNVTPQFAYQALSEYLRLAGV